MPKFITYASSYAPLAPGAAVISENIYTGLNLAEFFGNPTQPLDFYITIAAGVFVQSNTAAVPAISTKGLPPGSTLTINNLGFIIGAGGRGGSAHFLVEPEPNLPEAGQPGGDAIYTTVPTFIASAFGYIWGGGAGSAGVWDVSYTKFYPGSGGMGVTPFGGGEAGLPYNVSVNSNWNAKPFVSLNNWGAPGVDIWGTGGANDRDGGGSHGTYSGQPSSAFGTTLTPQSDLNGFQGYAVNVGKGGSVQWLDNAPSVTAVRPRVAGTVGARPEAQMHWSAQYDPWTIVLITSDTIDFSLAAYLGNPTQALKVFVWVAPGVLMSASDTSRPAFTTAGMPTGSTLFFKPMGMVIGRGGDGGTDRLLAPAGVIDPEKGQPGGDAIHLTIKTTFCAPSLVLGNIYTPIIAAGGGGGPLVRLLPIAEATVGGQGGMGGGQGGLGTAGNGDSLPIADVVEYKNSRGHDNAYLDATAISVKTSTYPVYKAANPGTPCLNSAGQAGSYGARGTDSKSFTSVGAITPYETIPAGEGGWALYAPNVSVGFCSCVMRSSSYWSATQYFSGRMTHESGYYTQIPNYPVNTRTVMPSTPPLDLAHVFNIANGTMNFDLRAAMNSTSKAFKAMVYLGENCVLGSASAAKPAFTTGAINPASRVLLLYAGIIAGCGGDGGGYENTNPNIPPNLNGTVDTWPAGNGRNGGDAVQYASGTLTYSAVTNLYTGDALKTRTINSATVKSGGGGGPALFTCDYYDAAGGWKYIPESVRIGLGGGGGAGGGKGGAGVFGNGGDGGRDFAYTADGRWNDQRGSGQWVTKLQSSSSITTDVVVSTGGYLGVAAASASIAAGTLYKTQTQKPNNVWGESKLYNILTIGKAGSPGTAFKAF